MSFFFQHVANQEYPIYHGYVLELVAFPTLQLVAPTAGGDVDGVCGHDVTPPQGFGGGLWRRGQAAIPGAFVIVRSAGSFAAGALLQVTADGRFEALSSGIAVLRALEASAGANVNFGAVFTSGRT